MNRQQFLRELVRELRFMSEEDRESAIVYYEEFFDEAGPENESGIIDELGSPHNLARELRAEYESGVKEPSGMDLAVPGSEEKDDAGTGSGYKSPFSGSGPGVRSPLGNDPFAEEEPKQNGGEYNYTKSDFGGENRWESQSQGGRRPYGSADPGYVPYGSRRASGQEPWIDWIWRKTEQAREKAEEAAEKAKAKKQEYDDKKRERDSRKNDRGHNYSYDYSNEKEGQRKQEPVYGEPREKRRLPSWAILLICIFAVPVGLPVLAVVFGLIVAVVGIFVAFVVAGGAIMATGVAVIVAGAWYVAFVPNLLLMVGAGLLLLGLGLPIIYLSVKFTGKICRSAGRGISSLFGKARGKEAHHD